MCPFFIFPDIQSFYAFPGDISWLFGTAWEARFYIIWYSDSPKSRNGIRVRKSGHKTAVKEKGPGVQDKYLLNPKGRTM